MKTTNDRAVAEEVTHLSELRHDNVVQFFSSWKENVGATQDQCSGQTSRVLLHPNGVLRRGFPRNGNQDWLL